MLGECPRQELRNEPPHDGPSYNPLIASLWIGSGDELAIKGLGIEALDYKGGKTFYTNQTKSISIFQKSPVKMTQSQTWNANRNALFDLRSRSFGSF